MHHGPFGSEGSLPRAACSPWQQISARVWFMREQEENSAPKAAAAK